MSKLEELGGLKGIRSLLTDGHEFGHRAASQNWYCNECSILALIEHIESLTAERDQFKKLHEEAVRGIRELGHQIEEERIAHTTERDALKRRVEELERDVEALGSTAAGADSMVTELTDKLQAAQKRVEELEHSWKCFRCGELFTEYEKAAEHFNGDFCEDEEPWCQFVNRMEAAEKRVEELERELNCPPFDPDDLPTRLEMNEDGSVSQVLETVGGDKVEPFMQRIKVLEAQLQAARKLAESVRAIRDARKANKIVGVPAELLADSHDMASDFLKMLEVT